MKVLPAVLCISKVDNTKSAIRQVEIGQLAKVGMADVFHKEVARHSGRKEDRS